MVRDLEFQEPSLLLSPALPGLHNEGDPIETLSGGSRGGGAGRRRITVSFSCKLYYRTGIRIRGVLNDIETDSDPAAVRLYYYYYHHSRHLGQLTQPKITFVQPPPAAAGRRAAAAALFSLCLEKKMPNASADLYPIVQGTSREVISRPSHPHQWIGIAKKDQLPMKEDVPPSCVLIRGIYWSLSPSVANCISA